MAVSNPQADIFFQQALERLRLQAQNPDKQYPELSSGGRTVVFIAGRKVADLQNVSYQTASQVEPLQTVDTHVSWELIPGQINVAASLTELVDPRTSAEARGLFATLQSYPHQPMVELQVFDKFGAELFVSRGYIVRTSTSTSIGGISQRNYEFVGVGFQHNVSQKFRAYPDSGLKLLQGLRTALKVTNRFGI